MTTYLIDPYNHTGYAQVLEERIDDGGTVETITYTLGHDVLTQASTVTGVKHLLYDGHGSTRQLIDTSGSVAAADSFSYDAYGVLLQGGSGTPGLTPPQTTALLYAGEYFDATAQHYYNRARWYNPCNGRFNRPDPFAGSPQDPQRLHKYLYAHCNPVNSVDPTGWFSLSEINVVGMIQATLFTMNLLGGLYHARGVVVSTVGLVNAWRAGDFWGGLPHIIMGVVHGLGLVLSAVGIITGVSGPPPGPAQALATVGSAGDLWAIAVANPAIMHWILTQVGPVAYSAYIVLAAKSADGGSTVQRHHRVPYDNKTYEHHKHDLWKQTGWTQDDLRTMPENQMLLENHGGRHWNEYHQAIRKMMDDGLRHVRGQGQEAARREMYRIFDDIRARIEDGTYKPYRSKDVRPVQP